MRKITPEIWGGAMWRTIHVVALGYPRNPPPAARAQYKAFYDSLRTVIPCSTCREGYVGIVDDMPVDAALGNPEDLFDWTVRVHNKVNEKLGKLPMTPEFVRENYMFADHSSPVDPAVDRSNLAGLAAYGAAFGLIAAAAYLVYLLFRPARRSLQSG